MEDSAVFGVCMISMCIGMGFASLIFRGMVKDAREDRRRAQQEAKHWKEGYKDLFYTTLNVIKGVKEEDEKKKTESANDSNLGGSGKGLEKA